MWQSPVDLSCMEHVHGHAGVLGWPTDATRSVSVLLLLLLCSYEANALQTTDIRQRRIFFHEYTSNCNYSSGANVNNISTTFMQVCLLALVTMTEQLLSVFQDWMVEWWNKIIIFSYECLIHKGRKRAGHKSLCVMYSCAFRRFLTSWLKNNVAYKFLCLEVR